MWDWTQNKARETSPTIRDDHDGLVALGSVALPGAVERLEGHQEGFRVVGNIFRLQGLQKLHVTALCYLRGLDENVGRTRVQKLRLFLELERKHTRHRKSICSSDRDSNDYYTLLL